MASADFSRPIGGRRRPPAPIVRRDREISQGKTLILPSSAAGFTCARVRLAFGLPRPLPGYPTAPASYPVPVRQLRVLPPASSPLCIAATQLPSANGSGQSARRGLAPPRSAPCLAHSRGWPAFADHDGGTCPHGRQAAYLHQSVDFRDLQRERRHQIRRMASHHLNTHNQCVSGTPSFFN